MEYKKSMIIIILAIFLFSITSVCASDTNDTIVSSEDTTAIELSQSDDITVTDESQKTIQTNDTEMLTASDEETTAAQNNLDTLSLEEKTYADLSNAVGSGGDIDLQPAYYKYNGESGSITIKNPGIINGNGAVIDMLGSNIRAFYVSVSRVTIKNLTIKNANYNNGHGGAIYFLNTGTVSNCNFTNNTATQRGGAIYFGNSGTVTNCNFTANTANEYGGAVYFFKTGNVTNCNFTGNTATYEGGAIKFSGSGTVSNCNFTNNTASDGGAIRFNGEGTVSNCNFTGNTATGDGGAIWMDQGTVTNSKFINNVGRRGGAILSNQWCGVIADTCIFKTDSDTTYNVDVHPPTLNADNFTTFYGSGEKLTFDLKTYSNMTVNNGNISISVYYKNNDSWVGNYSCLSGEGWTVDLPIGYYYAVFNTEYAGFKPVNRTITVNKVKTSLTASAVTTTYNVKKNLVITLKDTSGNALSGVEVTVKIKKVKTYTTDKNGKIKINVAKLVPKKYTAKISFAGNSNYLKSSISVKVTVKKATSKLTAAKKTFKKSVKTKQYTVALKDNRGKAINKAKLTLKVNGKTFKAKTNSKGKATFKITKLTKKGKHTATVTFKGDKCYNKVTKKVKITIK